MIQVFIKQLSLIKLTFLLNTISYDYYDRKMVLMLARITAQTSVVF